MIMFYADGILTQAIFILQRYKVCLIHSTILHQYLEPKLTHYF